MAKKIFDQKFGADLLDSVPKKPGVYRFINDKNQVIYVGKAVDLRRRLQQYRNFTRKKKERKQRLIVRQASKIEFTVCRSETEALLLENKLIQELRPTHNIEGAFAFLYPMLGLKRSKDHLALCYTSSEKELSSIFQLFGAFRSREMTRNAYKALKALFSLIGHLEGKSALKSYPRVDYSSICAFRQIDPAFDALLIQFLNGQSTQFLEKLSLELLEKPSARSRAKEVNEDLADLSSFFEWEALPLREALEQTGKEDQFFIPQAERDALFIRARV